MNSIKNICHSNKINKVKYIYIYIIYMKVNYDVNEC